ncbi:hypothetical protein PCE1_002647 [Barthelona sp. PCE]
MSDDTHTGTKHTSILTESKDFSDPLSSSKSYDVQQHPLIRSLCESHINDLYLDQLRESELFQMEYAQHKLRDKDYEGAFIVFGKVELKIEFMNHPITLDTLQTGDIIFGTAFSQHFMPLTVDLGANDAMGSSGFVLSRVDYTECQFFEFSITDNLDLFNSFVAQKDVLLQIADILSFSYNFEHFYLCNSTIRRRIVNFLSMRNVRLADVTRSELLYTSGALVENANSVKRQSLLLDFIQLDLLQVPDDIEVVICEFLSSFIAMNLLPIIRDVLRMMEFRIFIKLMELQDINVLNTNICKRFNSKRYTHRKTRSFLREELPIIDSFSSAEFSPSGSQTDLHNLDKKIEKEKEKEDDKVRDIDTVAGFDNIEAIQVETLDVVDLMHFDDPLTGAQTPTDVRAMGLNFDLLSARMAELGYNIVDDSPKLNLVKKSHKIDYHTNQRLMNSSQFVDSEASLTSFQLDVPVLRSTAIPASPVPVSVDIFEDKDISFFNILKDTLVEAGALNYEHIEALDRCCSDAGVFLSNKFDVTPFARRPTNTYYLFYYLCHFLGIIKAFNLREANLRNFCFDILETMNADADYHGRTHILDVLYVVVLWAAQAKIEQFTPEETLALVLACFGHDSGHPGLSEACLRKIGHEIVEAFPGASPLEKLHFRITKHSILHSGLLSHLGDVTVSLILKKVEILILATDMGRHMAVLSEGKTLKGMKLKNLSEDKRLLFLQLLIKAADISNVSRHFGLAKKWAQRYYSEVQTMSNDHPIFKPDLKPPLPKNIQEVANQQIGFISFLVKPLFQMVVDIYPNIQFTLDTIDRNVQKYKIILENEEGNGSSE